MTTGLLPPWAWIWFQNQARVALSKYFAQEMFIVQFNQNQMLESSGPSFEDTPWITRVCVNSITGLEMQRLPCLCVWDLEHTWEGKRGALWITVLFRRRVWYTNTAKQSFTESTKTRIRGAHKTRRGNAAGQVMPSPRQQWAHVWSVALEWQQGHVMFVFSDLAIHFQEFENITTFATSGQENSF